MRLTTCVQKALLVCCGRAAALGLGLALSGSIVAQTPPSDHLRELGELSIKELMELELGSVYGASRYVQKAARAPASISVLTAQDIRMSGARTLGDVLDGMRGLYVSNDRNYSYLGIRGFQRPNDYNTRMLVLIDGHRMNDNVYDLGSVGREGIVDIELIERVEVIRGPSSSVYGSSAFFGVINVVTKTSAALDGVEASAEVGSYDSYKARLTFGETFSSDVEWLVSASSYASDGPGSLYFPEFDQRISSDPRAANDGLAIGLDAERASSFFTSLRHNDFTFSAFWNGRTKTVPTASFDTVFNDPREVTEDYRSYLDLRYDHSFSESLGLQARIFYDDYTYKGSYPYDFASPGASPDIYISRDDTVGRWLGTEWQLTARSAGRHTVTVGGEYRENLREYQSFYYDIEPIVYDLVDDRSSQILGVFAQSETTLGDHLLLTAGLRYDRYSGNTGDTLNPRLGLIYYPNDDATFKALYGEAFRAPNPFEQHYYLAQAERPALRPETISTYEVVYERAIGNYRLMVSGYVYEVRDLISQTTTHAGDLYFDNLDSARAKGLEMEVERKFPSGASLRASYAAQQAIDATTGLRLTSSPRHLAKLNLNLPLSADVLFVGLDLQYHGAARTLSGNRTDDFVTANLTLFNERHTRGFELSGTLYNLFDAAYSYPGAQDHAQDVIEQNGRTLQGKLSYRF